jgi:uncharacterized SAM-binding protein YcdF (DUF218 family)
MSLLADLAVNGGRAVLTALVLPPVPLLALALWGAWRARRQRRDGAALVIAAVVGLWFSQCDVSADALQRTLGPPHALTKDDIDGMAARARAGGSFAILMLGGGVEPQAPEYGAPQLETHAMARLRYALWLGRETGIPVGATGGGGPAQDIEGLAEAAIAARIARDEAGRPLRWAETRSRTTRENAAYSVPMLEKDGVREVWIVTHAWHMRRALRDFERAASEPVTSASAPRLIVHAAPMGLGQPRQIAPLRWMPSGEGGWRVRAALREWLGLLAGA